jgi:hypothetical protein
MDFSDILSRSVEEALRDLVGDRAKETLFNCLERQGIGRHEIFDSLSKFEDFLGQRFGKAGKVVEKQIAKRLYTDLGLELVGVPHLALSDYVQIAHRRVSDAGTSD